MFPNVDIDTFDYSIIILQDLFEIVDSNVDPNSYIKLHTEHDSYSENREESSIRHLLNEFSRAENKHLSFFPDYRTMLLTKGKQLF